MLDPVTPQSKMHISSGGRNASLTMHSSIIIAIYGTSKLVTIQWCSSNISKFHAPLIELSQSLGFACKFNFYEVCMIL